MREQTAEIYKSEIPIEARIVSVADVFDVLSSDRPCRQNFSLDEAIELVVSMKGKELDSTLFDLFLSSCQTTYVV